MALPIGVEICTPERAARSIEADEVVLPGSGGVFTVLEGHTPAISLLRSGVMIAYSNGEPEHFYAVNGGFAEVLHNRIVVLAHTIEHHEEIDRDRADEARQRAEEAITAAKDTVERARAEAALARALARLSAHSKEDLR